MDIYGSRIGNDDVDYRDTSDIDYRNCIVDIIPYRMVMVRPSNNFLGLVSRLRCNPTWIRRYCNKVPTC